MQAIIFDVDGTLVDSVDLHAKAWQQTFTHFGYDFSFDQVRSQIGKGGDQLIPYLLSHSEAEAQGEEIQKYRGDLFKREYLSQVVPFPNVRPLFKRILEEGWRVGLASSAKEDELKIYEDMVQVSDLVEAKTSSDDADKSKPHPDIFLAAWQKLGSIKKEDCVVIGDSPFDAEAAIKAHMQAIGVLSGGFLEGELRKAGVQAIFQDPTDLLERFEDLKQVLAKMYV